ncbi:MAG TPA: hypothetical protein VD886_08630, partial [Herpetosiphonaceae bacterium]|nr:hypothetical protein [Herpetosiphonaceae bacterium]
GTLGYTFTHNAVSMPAQASFSLPGQPQLTTIQRNHSFAGRRLRFQGKISNAALPDTMLAATQVVVATAAGETLCVSRSRDAWGSDSYSCDAVVTGAEPIALTYTVGGEWGSAVLGNVQQVTPPAIGERSQVQADLPVTVPMLRFTGTLTFPDGARVSGALMDVISEVFVYGSTMGATIDEEGRYEAYAILKHGQTGGELTYYVTYDMSTTVITGSITGVNPNGITTVERDLRFNTRMVSLYGTIIDQDSNYLTADSIRISNPTLGVLCEFQESADYWCSFNTTTLDSFVVEYTITGAFGTRHETDTISAGPLGSATEVARTLRIDLPQTARLAAKPMPRRM